MHGPLNVTFRKVCMLVEKQLLSVVTSQEVTAGASSWSLSQIACQPVASRDVIPGHKVKDYLEGGP